MGKKNKHSLSSVEQETHALTQPITPVPSVEVNDGTLPQDPIAMLKELKRREAALADRERRLLEKEIEADAGFAQKNKAALSLLNAEKNALERQASDLKAQLTGAIERELIEGKTRRSQEYEKEMENWRRLQREALNGELRDKRTAEEQSIKLLKKDCEQWCSEERTNMEKQKKDIAELQENTRITSETLKQQRIQWEEEHTGKDRSLILRERKLLTSEQSLDSERREMQKVLAEAESRGRELSKREVESLRRRLSDAEGDCERLQTQVEAQQKLERDSGHRDFGQIVAENTELRRELGQLRSIHDMCPSKDVQEKLASAMKERDAQEAKASTLAHENAQYRAKQVKWESYVGELETLKQQKELAERRLGALQVTMTKYEEDVNRLKSLYELPKERESRIGVIEQPHFKLADIKRSRRSEEPTEAMWLGNILAACEESHISFSPRLLMAFHTALKSSELSPLVVLAGVSGTGKSELPRLYSRFGGLLFLPIAVQPNWDSPQDLFGFFNYGENRFNAKPLVQAMNQMQRNQEDGNGLDDTLLLVLLDEMNLAHIELYFSDLLSALERRRGVKHAHVEIDLGSGLEKYQLPVSRNLLWSGTMNEDETTKILSDKVLDRGNLLSFPRPIHFRRRLSYELKPPAPLLPLSTWKGWLDAQYEFAPGEVDSWKTAVEEINSCLAAVGKGLGHRVWQSIETYMSHYPLVVSAITPEDRSAHMLTAFEDQLVMKVMPKLRGIETRGHAKTECLGKIGEIIRKITPNLMMDFHSACEAGHGFFLWSSAHYLDGGSDGESTPA